MSTTPAGPVVMLDQAVGAISDLARLTRPAITDLSAGDLYDITGALTDLVAALPQVLTQLAAYPDAEPAADCLNQANHLDRQLAVVLDTTHQTLD